MTTLLVIVWVASCILLLLHASVRLERTRHSHYELKRRDNQPALRRERLFSSLTTLRAVVATLLVIVTVVVALAIWGGWGAVYTALVVVAIQPLANLGFVSRVGHGIYDPQEPRILNLIENYSLIGWLLGGDYKTPADQKIESTEQLLHLIETSGSVLSDDQRTIVANGLNWHATTVSDIMTPAKEIFSIKHSELLGPLVLDDLHRSGHNRFPVTRGSIDTIVGVLDITQLLELAAGKHSETVEKVMSPQALRIEVDEILPTALAMLQKSHQHMLVVVDEGGNTAGILTLSDIASSLLGKNRGRVV